MGFTLCSRIPIYLLQVYIDGDTRGYYRVLPSGRILPHIHRVFNIIWTSTETAAQSWHHSYRGGIYPARYLTTSGPFHNPWPPFHSNHYFPSYPWPPPVTPSLVTPALFITYWSVWDWQGILIDANFLVIPALHPLYTDHYP